MRCVSVIFIVLYICIMSVGCTGSGKDKKTIENKNISKEESADIEKELQKAYKEVRLLQDKAKTKKEYALIVNRYQSIFNNYSNASNKEILSACHYELALIYVKRYKDVKKALDNLKIIVNKYPQTSWVKKAKNGISKLSAQKKEDGQSQSADVNFKDRVRNREFRFIMKIPSGWTYTEETGNPAIVLFLVSEDGFKKNNMAYPNVNLICQRLEDDDISVADYVNFFVEEELTAISGYEKGKSEIINIKGNESYSKIHSVFRDDIGKKITQNQVYCIKRKFLYILTFSDVEEDFEKNLPVFNSIVDNFDFM